MKFGLPLLILPFIFVYRPELLAIGSLSNIVLTFITTLISILSICISISGYSIKSIGYIKRIFYILSGVLILLPNVYLLFAGLAIFTFLLIHDKGKVKLFT